MTMNYIKGFRFHPTDAESIELLWEKIVQDRVSMIQIGDSRVPVITQLEDICKFDNEELPGLSGLDSGDNVWYFFCEPKYKYRNSKRKNRVTNKGYWKPTGKACQIVTTYEGRKITGTRQTLVFYKGRVGEKNKKENKTPWVIHEFELTLDLPNQKILTLSKLKKKCWKVDVSRGDEGESSQRLPSNLENHFTNNEIPKDKLNSNKPLTEPVEFTEYNGNQSESATNEQNGDGFIDSLINNNDELDGNQLSFGGEIEDPKLQSNFPTYNADTDIPKNQEGLGELINQKQKTSNDCVWAKNQVSDSEQHNSSWCSVLTANNQTYSNGDNQPNTLFAEEGSSLAFENPVPVDYIPMGDSEFDEFFHNGLFMAEIPPISEAPKNSDGVQNLHFSTNEQDDEFWKFFFTNDEVEAYPEVFGTKQQNLTTMDGNFNFSFMTTTEAPKEPCPMESSRKRPRLEFEELSKEDIEAARVQEKNTFNTKKAQVDSYNQTAFE